jgi:hypothetical protein
MDSDWCERWRARRHSWRHTSEGGFDPRLFEVAPIREREARAFVEQNHYAATYPAAQSAYGLYEGPWLAGVAVLSIPVQRRVLEVAFPALEPYTESLELGRFVLAERVPANGESWFLARVFEFAAAAGVRGVLSFSDPVARNAADGHLIFPGHLGIIYQASNAAYLGRTGARTLRLLPDGQVLSERAIQKIRSGERGWDYSEQLLVGFGARPRRRAEERMDWLQRALAEAGVRALWHGGNHRYAFRIGPVRRLVSLGLEPELYPKAL